MEQERFAKIKDMLVLNEREGDHLRCLFRCPNTKRELGARGLVVGSTTAEQVLMPQGRPGLLGSLRDSVLGVFRGAKTPASAEGRTLTDAERDAAVARAYLKVASAFKWDSGKEQFHLHDSEFKTDRTAFEERIEAHPISEANDLKVFGRMLIEIASADGTFAGEEKALLSDFMDPSHGTLDGMAGNPPLAEEDLRGATEDVRPTMLMCAWAIAYCDADLADEELSRLAEYQSSLDLYADRSASLQNDAREFLVDQAFARCYAGGSLDKSAHEETKAFGRSIGLSDRDIDDADSRYRKRYGLV